MAKLIEHIGYITCHRTSAKVT